MNTCTKPILRLCLLSLLVLPAAVGAAAPPAKTAVPAISSCDKPFIFGFGSWEEAKTAFAVKARRTSHLREERPRGCGRGRSERELDRLRRLVARDDAGGERTEQGRRPEACISSMPTAPATHTRSTCASSSPTRLNNSWPITARRWRSRRTWRRRAKRPAWTRRDLDGHRRLERQARWISCSPGSCSCRRPASSAPAGRSSRQLHAKEAEQVAPASRGEAKARKKLLGRGLAAPGGRPRGASTSAPWRRT